MKQNVVFTRYSKGKSLKLEIEFNFSIISGKQNPTSKLKVKDIQNNKYRGHVLKWIINNLESLPCGIKNIKQVEEVIKLVNSKKIPSNLYVKFINPQSTEKVIRDKNLKAIQKRRKKVSKKKIAKTLTPQKEFLEIREKIYKKYTYFRKMHGVTDTKSFDLSDEKYKKVLGIWKELVEFVLKSEKIPFVEYEIGNNQLEFRYYLIKHNKRIPLAEMINQLSSREVVVLKMKTENRRFDSWHKGVFLNPESVAIAFNWGDGFGKNMKYWSYNSLAKKFNALHLECQESYNNAEVKWFDNHKKQALMVKELSKTQKFLKPLNDKYFKYSISSSDKNQLIELIYNINGRDVEILKINAMVQRYWNSNKSEEKLNYSIQLLNFPEIINKLTSQELKNVINKIFKKNVTNFLKTIENFKNYFNSRWVPITREKHAKNQKNY